MVKCEVCGHNMKSIYHKMAKKENKKFYYCPSCGLRWAAYLDFNSTFHSKLNEESRQDALNEIRGREFEQVNNLLKKYVDKGSKGLEVGCAYGWYMDSVGEQYELEGIEPEFDIAEQARKKGHKVYTGFFPQDIPDDKNYDFMVFNNVWEHINHTSELIEGSLHFLKDGGVMIITIPLSSGGLYRIAESFEKAGRTNELTRLWQLHFHSPHIYYYNKSNFERIMETRGCRLVACEDIRGNIDLKKMKERFEMDADEKHGGLKAAVFYVVYPVLKHLPADKAVFVFRYEGQKMKHVAGERIK